ncbi:MAG: undecaprenyldiphospho-muramoylpentapeptide beta-N-acetylglucosaminyltransferase [Brevundimonas sp.]|uniref:undecaprenyldiphospho-muramoylpentapeptide beta-N-acetylglucosaminyltransferase n=1 Tax=Brevundimonas sp. TaxID=1871086 RepID=UPI003001F4AA
MTKVCVVAAGGTGGHLFPAQALAEEMARRGWRIVLATDRRGQAFAEHFPADERLALDSATGSGPVGLLKAGAKIAIGVAQARKAFRRLDASVVVGFGGYPSAPSLLAAMSMGLPTLIHEQNAVLGRTNRLLAGRVGTVASAFPTLGRLPDGLKDRLEVVGNPVRPPIAALAGKPYRAPGAGDDIHLLVTGGSQGARILSDTVPRAIAALPEALRKRLKVVQQARPEFLEAAAVLYAGAGVAAEVAPFFSDMAARLAEAHLAIGRAGASTCTELAVVGLPSVLVPLKIATDDHQRHNASGLVEAGGAVLILEDDLTVEGLTATLSAILGEPGRLAAMAEGARAAALPDAAARLADLVESAAG